MMSEPQDPALGNALNFMREKGNALVNSVETEHARLQVLAGQIGPTLSGECMGNPCPVLSAVAQAHHSVRFKIAQTVETKTILEETLQLSREHTIAREALFGNVMDSVSEGTMSLDVGDSLLDFSLFDDDNNGGEVLIREKIAIKSDRIAEDTVKMERLQELFGSICVKQMFPRNAEGVSVFVRKALKRPARDGECFGVEFRPQVTTASGRLACTNSAATEMLHTAIDEGLVKLDKHHQELDTRKGER